MTSRNQQSRSGRSSGRYLVRWAVSLPASEVAEAARPACEAMLKRMLGELKPGVEIGVRWSETREIVLLEMGDVISPKERQVVLAQISACLALFRLTLRQLHGLCPEVFSEDLLWPVPLGGDFGADSRNSKTTGRNDEEEH